jgi:DNA-binding transcriptional ArsR family regulator
MARLLPSLSSTAADDATPRVIGLDSADADDLIGALSSGTARRILSLLHEDPASASEVAAQVDSSLQNVQYHLGRMEDAGLVEVCETVYSEKGREMKVYAPADKPLVVVAARESETAGLRDVLTRLLGAVGLLGLASVLVQYLLESGSQAAQGAATSADSAEATRIAAETTTAAAATGLPPGLLFFLGGLVVILAAAVGWWYRSR